MQDTFEIHKLAGKQVPCSRCGDLCAVAPAANLSGRPLKFASGEKGGECASGAITTYLKSDEIDVSYLLPEGVTVKEALSAPHVQEMFGRLLKVGRSDLTAIEINWQKVIANWEL